MQIGQHRAAAPASSPSESPWPKYASAAKKATGQFMELYLGSLCIPGVRFVGGTAHIGEGDLVGATRGHGLGFATRMIHSGVPQDVAMAWESVVASSVDDYFGAFQIRLSYPLFDWYRGSVALPHPNVPIALAEGFSGAAGLVMESVLAISLGAKLLPFANWKGNQEKVASSQNARRPGGSPPVQAPISGQTGESEVRSATAEYASWFSTRFDAGLQMTLIHDVLAHGAVNLATNPQVAPAGPVMGFLMAPSGFLAHSAFSAVFADWMSAA